MGMIDSIISKLDFWNLLRFSFVKINKFDIDFLFLHFLTKSFFSTAQSIQWVQYSLIELC